ncbi:MAG: hypothetical protein ACRETD_12025, partial [Steroidobacteraceae bacterium]
MHARTWTAEEFASSRETWDRLLAASDADPLFMSWDWQWRWWRHHADALGATLHLLAIYTPAGELVGLAPFYSRTVVVRRLFTVCRMELIGIAWRNSQAVFSDYLDLIAVRARRDAVVVCVAGWLAGAQFWQELVLACARPDSLAAQLARTGLAGLTY